MENAKTPSKKKLLLGVLALVLVIGALIGVYFAFSPKPTQGAKTVTVEVIPLEGEGKEYTYHTDAEYLGQLHLEEELIEGTESEYGLYITAVDGIPADESANQWWAISKSGEMATTGVDTTPIADGDHFELTLSVW